MSSTEAKYNDINDMKYLDYAILIDEDECRQESFIDPSKDGRKPIWETANANDDIIKCIGYLRIRYADEEILTNPPEINMGTGTIIKIDAQDRCYVLTVAHNACQHLRECLKCYSRTIAVQCVKCNQCTTKKLKPLKLVKPTSIEFVRRCIVRARTHNGIQYKFGDPISVYEIDQCYIQNALYNLWSSPMAGYDIAIMIFTCKDKETTMYNYICSRINLTYDPTFGGRKNRLYIYGYPADKYYAINNLKQYQMYGMSTGMHGNKFQVGKHAKSNKEYFINNEIDTQPGQSGSIVWSYDGNNKQRYIIYGIHSGGNEANLSRGRKFGVNYGTLLCKENLIWIQHIENILSLQSSFVRNEHRLLFEQIQEQQKQTEYKLQKQLQQFELKEQIQKKECENFMSVLLGNNVIIKQLEEEIKTERNASIKKETELKKCNVKLEQKLQQIRDEIKNQQKQLKAKTQLLDHFLHLQQE